MDKVIIKTAKMDLDQIKKSLIKNFGVEFRDEIISTFSDNGAYSSYGNSGVFTADGQEYVWIENEDEAERIATEIVGQDLEESPGNFNQTWLTNWIQLSSSMDRNYMALEEANAIVGNMDDNEILDYVGVEIDSNDENYDKKVSDAREQIISDKSDDIYEALGNPYNYFVESGLTDEKDYLEIVKKYIDIDGAAEDAIDTDGWAHFLSLYDGDYDTTPEGVVFFQGV